MAIQMQVLSTIVEIADSHTAIRLWDLSQELGRKGVDESSFVDHIMFLVNYGCLKMMLRGRTSVVQILPDAVRKLEALAASKGVVGKTATDRAPLVQVDCNPPVVAAT